MTVLSIPLCSTLNAITNSKLQMEMLMILSTYTNEVHTARNLRLRSIRTGTILLRTMNMQRPRILVTKTMTGSDAGQYFHLGKGVHLMQLILSRNPPEYPQVRSQQQHRVDVRTGAFYWSCQAKGSLTHCDHLARVLPVATPTFILHTWQSPSSSFTPRQPS